MGPRYWPVQSGLPGFSSAAKSSPGVGMLMESLRIALASWSEDKRGESAPRAQVSAPSKMAARYRRPRNMASSLGHVPKDCQKECRRGLLLGKHPEGRIQKIRNSIFLRRFKMNPALTPPRPVNQRLD